MGLPTGEDHPNPLKEPELAPRPMFLVALSLPLVIGSRPDRMADRVVGIFLNALAEKLGTGRSPMHDAHRAAGSRHRRDAGRVLHLRRGVNPGTVRAKRGEQTGRRHAPRAGQTGKDGGIGMRGEPRGKGPVTGGDVVAHRPQQLGEHRGVEPAGWMMAASVVSGSASRMTWRRWAITAGLTDRERGSIGAACPRSACFRASNDG